MPCVKFFTSVFYWMIIVVEPQIVGAQLILRGLIQQVLLENPTSNHHLKEMIYPKRKLIIVQN